MRTLVSEIKFVNGGADDIVGGVSHEEFIGICRSQYQMNPFENAVDKVLWACLFGMKASLLGAVAIELYYSNGGIKEMVSNASASLYIWYGDHFSYNEENGYYCCLS